MQHKRLASARHPQMQMASDHRTASTSATRQQQSTSNLHVMARGPGLAQSSNPKKMKLIRTRVAGGSTVGVQEKKQRLKSPSSAIVGPSIESRSTRNKVTQGRQQSLNLSSNQFLKAQGPPSVPQTAKHQLNQRHQQPMIDKFMFSATSPPVQINKQAIMMASANGMAQQVQQQQQQTGKTGSTKQKESLGHITASRRQKQSGLQINVDGGQSIVIQSPSRGHVIASPASHVGGVPDNLLFYGMQQPNSTMSPAHHRQHTTASHLESLNHMSPKTGGGLGSTSVHQQSQQQQVVVQTQTRRQQSSTMSKKTLRQKAISTTNRDANGKYETLKHQQNLQLAGQSSTSNYPQKNSYKQNLTSYQITPKNGGQQQKQFEQVQMGSVGPRSTKARQSQSFVKGRFIDNSSNVQQRTKHLQSPNQLDQGGFNSPLSHHNQPTLSTLDQQKQMQMGFSPRQESNTYDNNHEPGQMLFLSSPSKHTNNRLVSPTHNATRSSAHSTYNRPQTGSKITTANKNQKNTNNSSLGIKTASTAVASGGRAIQSASNTLKIQHMRNYNETSSGIANNSMTTKHENSQRYAMRNNFITSGATDQRPLLVSNDLQIQEQAALRQGTGSNLRHFYNQSSTSAVNQSMQASSQKQGAKKRKLTLNQRAGGPTNSMRPMSGAVRGPNRGTHGYTLRTNITYATNASHHGQVLPANNRQQQRQSMSVARGKKIQVLQNDQENLKQQQARVYSPNAAINGRRDINQELQGDMATVPQFYPATTTNQSAPTQIQFTQASMTTYNQGQSVANQQKLQKGSSTCLIDEPDIVCDINSGSQLIQAQTQDQENNLRHNRKQYSSTQVNNIQEADGLVSGTQYSVEQQPSHQLISQQVGKRRQSYQMQDLQQNNSMLEGANSQGTMGLQRTENGQLTGFTQSVQSSGILHQTQQHTRQSRTSIVIEGGRDSDLQRRQQFNSQTGQLLNQKSQMSSSNVHELGTADAASALVIPNLSINLPQTTTAATAPKLSVDNMLMALDQNKNDINQKIQQRKIESARRPADPQPQTLVQNKPQNNLQVVVIHEMNPRVGLDTSGQYKALPQTTTNQSTSSYVPKLNFAPPQQQTTQQSHRQNQQPISNQGNDPKTISSSSQVVPQSTTADQKTSSNQNVTTSNGTRRQNSQSHQNNTAQLNASSHRSSTNNNHNESKSNVTRHSKQSQNSPKKSKDSTKNAKYSQLNQPSAKNSQIQLEVVSSSQPPPTREAQQSSSNNNNNNLYNQQIKFPMTPAKCLKLFGSRHLTEYEKTEILDFPQVYYFGEGVKKIQAQKPPVSQSQNYGGRESSKNRNSQQEEEDNNCGYDDSKGNYKVMMKDHIAYRYEMIEHLGKGSFGIAIKCYDHKTEEYVALKIIKNKKKYYYQAGVELKILQYLKDNDPDDTMNIIHMKDYVIFRKHLCITFELMSINLYEFLKLNDFEGLSLSLVRRFAIQLLYSLKFLKEHDVIHCDLKPENILLKDPSKSGIKIIDFGSSCFREERVYTYIQSRFYRAPEIILGINYTPCIDMWSFGCIMAEFAMGYPIFPGEDETDQISLIMEVCGIPAAEVLSKGQRKTKFFNESNMPKLVPNSHGKVRKPGTKVLDDILECSDQSFVNFVERCLEWDPDKRMTPDEAIRHQWILEGLPPKVLVHHQKLHNIPTKSLPDHIREARAEYLSSQPLDVQMEFRDDENDDGQSSSATSQQINNNQQQQSKQHGKSKSMERSSGYQSNSNGGQPLVVKHNHRQKYESSAQNASQTGTRNQRQSQSFDGTSGYRHQNETANSNAQSHYNLRHKKQAATGKSSHNTAGNDSKPSVEQMLHGHQRS